MNSRLRAKAYKLLKDRDGEKCVDCKRIPTKEVKNPLREVRKLIVHHLDNNNDHNPPDGSNWLLLCQPCNIKRRVLKAKRSTRKFASFKRLKLSLTRESEREEPIIRYAEMWKNRQAEQLFRDFVAQTISELKEVEKGDLLDAGAENHYKKTQDHISQQALKRYLDKLSNDINGNYQYVKRDDHYYVHKRGADQQ